MKNLMILFLVLGIASSASALATNLFWDYCDTHMWSDPGNWALGHVPTTGETAWATSNGTQGRKLIIGDTESFACANFYVGRDEPDTRVEIQGGTLTFTGTFRVALRATPNHVIDISGDALVTGGGLNLTQTSSTGATGIVLTVRDDAVLRNTGYTQNYATTGAILDIRDNGEWHKWAIGDANGVTSLATINAAIGEGAIRGNGIVGNVAATFVPDPGGDPLAGYVRVFVPEPATIMLLGLGGLFLRKRR